MFLATKLFLPPQPPGAIAREELYAAMDESWTARARLLLLSAPPGYGKTTLLSGWVQARAIPCAWVSLDAQDNDPGRFFQLIARALEPHFAGLQDLTAILRVPQVTNFESLFGELINRIAQSGQSVLLALDDYHVIQAQGIHSLLQLLLDHLPPQLRLAVLTREDPPLALARLRARRQMLEIRASELAFTIEEGQALLVERLNLPLDARQIGTLVERTEGWAAGLQLAALTLRGREQPEALIESFRGSHRFVLDYLAGEVLDALPSELRAFLCRSAVLERFSPALCDKALATTDSQEMIARAAASNLFLVPLDEERAWHRYHHLMADILKAEVPPEERLEICRRAARWWQDQGQPAEAVRYALEGQDYPFACSAIRTAAIPTAESGLLSTALGWLEALPQEVLLGDPELCVLRAWFLLFNGRFRETAAWMEQIGHLLPDLPRPLAGLLLGMQSWMPSIAGQRMDGTRLQAALEMTEGRYPYFAPMLLLAIGQAQRAAGDVQEALRSFEEGARLAESTSGAVSALILRNNQAFLLNESGARQAAAQLLKEEIDTLTGTDGRPTLLAGIPMIPYGIFQFESGALDEAYETLTQSINMVRRLGMYDILAHPANHTLQQLLADLGRSAEAFALNKEVRRLAQKSGLGMVVQESEVMAAWIQLLAGDPQPAEEWAAAHPLPSAGQAAILSTSLVLHARLLSARGEGSQAAALLAPLAERFRAAGLLLTWVRASIELALAHLGMDQIGQATAVLVPAAECAARCGYRQPFARNQAALAPVLARLPGGLLQAHPAQPTASTASRPNVQAPVESLTTREMEILRLAAAGLSNAEIAERLYLTTGTVKWFMNQIFGKLGASRRTEAVARAQAAGLL